MERLSGQDAYFLYQETPAALMHTLKICIVEAPERAFDYAGFVRDVEKSIARIPLFRRRVVPIPMGIHHPLVIDEHVDVEQHLHHIAVPPPGTRCQLDAVIAEIARGKLDRSRPLWEFWVVEGLQGGQIAYINKIHHTLADGVASASYIDKAMYKHPQEALSAAPGPYRVETIPSRSYLVASSLLALFKDFGRFPGLLHNSMQRQKAVARRNECAQIVPPKPYDAAICHTRLNRALSPLRSFATVQFELQQFQAIKQGLGGTVNDVVLAVAAGALRQYLLGHRDLPDKPLVAAVPVSADRETATVRMFGNNVAYFHTHLRTDIAEPVARYVATQQVTGAAKEVLQMMGPEAARQWMQYIPPRLFSWLRRRDYETHAADSADFPLAANVIISNVPGPREYRYSEHGDKYTALYSAGPLTEGVGLNITAWSYAGQLAFGLIACKKACPDLHHLAQLMRDEVALLQQCADAAVPGKYTF
jgi:diacylglycerol O-acyltransferase